MRYLLHEEDTEPGWGRQHSGPSWIAAGLLLVTITVFLLATPRGFLNKTDMVGYAVCHQIESHSFLLAGQQLPLCARCTGTFLGALTGLVGQAFILRRRRASAFPSSPIMVALIGFTLLWAADGLNSYLALVGGPNAYEPTNALRLITGALNGLTLSALVYPVFNISVWRRPGDEPGVRSLQDLAVLMLMEATLVGLVLSGQGFLLYPLAILSAFAVLTLLSSINTVLAVLLLGQDNSIDTWREALLPVSIGLILSFIQIGIIDLLRYALTGTLDGIPLLQ